MKKKEKKQKVELSQKSVDAIAKAVAREVAKTLIVYSPVAAKTERMLPAAGNGNDSAPRPMIKG
jgi:hypothetical protein